jgi:hypothetical protein
MGILGATISSCMVYETKFVGSVALTTGAVIRSTHRCNRLIVRPKAELVRDF